MIPCDLCALDCGKSPFTLATPAGTLNFCCEGCRGIYEMLNEINETSAQPVQNGPQTTKRNSQ